MRLNKYMYNLYKESGINVLEIEDLNKAINIYENIPENENIITKSKLSLDLELIIYELKNSGIIDNNEEKQLRILPLSLKIKKIEKILNDYRKYVINEYHNIALAHSSDIIIDKLNYIKNSINYIDVKTNEEEKILDELRKQKIKILRKM